jgi:hypothetical protein
METLTETYESVAGPSSNSGNGSIGTSARPITVSIAESGSVSERGSRKRKERAEGPMDHQDRQLLAEGSSIKQRKKAVNQDIGGSSASPKKQSRPRKDPSVTSPMPRGAAKGNTGKGKGRAKDVVDPNTTINPTKPDSASGKVANGDDSEFETDDDMVEIISTRIPQPQKSKVEVVEALDQVSQGTCEEDEFDSSGGEESDHEGYEGHDHLEMEQASRPSSSLLDAGYSKVVGAAQAVYSIFPTEVLQRILLYLPLSKIARLSRVSKAWLDAARVLPVWKEACTKAKLGNPRKKYKTHMALVCANSYWICERCMSFSKGREHYADLPLPVEDEDDNNLVWALCLACRIEYFERHPEPLKEDKVYRSEFAWVVQTKQLAPHAVFLNYALRGENLHGISSTGRVDTRYQLFDRASVQRRALEVHGGWVGVDACATNPGRKRAAACNERAKECRLFKKKPLTKKRSPVSEEKKAARKEALEQRRAEREEARQENWMQRQLWDRVIRLGKRHKWHTTASWRKNRYC